VRPVLLYGYKDWKITKTEEKRQDSLRKIQRIWWPKRVQNETITEITGVNKISDEIRGRRWHWIEHVLRKERNNDCMVAMEWQPEGRRKTGQPKISWRRTVEKERRQEG